MAPSFRITLLFLLLCIFTCTAFFSFGFPCNDAERGALLKFKHSFIDESSLLGSWVGKDCCNWKGVGCDNVTDNVIKLDLRGDPFSYSNLEAGEVNPALLELKYLTYLDLSFVYFSGSTFPEFFGSMSQLQHLDLSFANLKGKVPNALGNLTQLVFLDLGFPCWPSYCESGNLEWASKLKSLQYLHMSGVDLSQALDSLNILFKLPSLSNLTLSSCGLGNSHLFIRNSSISSSHIHHLDLNENYFDGPIPHFIQNLSTIRFLDLSSNHLISPIPSWLGDKVDLEHLDLSYNYFNGLVPTFNALGNLTQLVFLDLSFSCRSSYCESGNLEWASKLKNLQYLDMSGANLSQALDSLNILFKLPSLLNLTLSGCQLGNTHLFMRNSSVSSSHIQLLDLMGNLFSGPFPLFIHNLSDIRHIDLSHNYFSSSIPPWFGNKVDLNYLSLAHNSFTGPFPHMLHNLSSLTELDLSDNYFSSSIPPWFGNKVELNYLRLAHNSFTGPFPHMLHNSSSLAVLDLSDNQFSSSIPSWVANKTYLVVLDLSHNHFDLVDGGIMNIITHLCSLRDLDLSYNQLQEYVSDSHVSFFGCSQSSLEYLYLNNNNISGQLPLIGSLPSLQILDLSYNNFESFSPSLAGFSSLDSLDMSNNNFRVLPPLIGTLSTLYGLDLSYNHLSVVHQISLANLSNLGFLDISSNSATLDISPDWMPPFNLRSLYIRSCKLNSPFPKWILSQKSISKMDLTEAGIFGPLPDNIGNAFPWLEALQVANNDINGSIPISLCNFKGLLLELQKNRMSGMIPDCWENSTILGLDLSTNRLSGPIPNSLTKASKLKLLNLNNNSLEGELPLSWSNLESLEFLDVGKNNLHGEIPPYSGAAFPHLEVLILRENSFKGMIPLQLCLIHTLRVIDLAINNLVGTIPQCFGHFKSMVYIQNQSGFIASPPNLSSIYKSPPQPLNVDDKWSAAEIIKGAEREYTKTLHLLVNMDLSCNNLVGVIPTELTGLSKLISLNLSHNHLGGIIPKEIGKMKSLEALDLSCNNLSGSIPESISSLNYLSTLNLSFNNLQGRIPTGNQLQTLANQYSIYTGNPGLCGDPLPKKCPGDSLAHPLTTIVPEDGDEAYSKHEKMWFYLVMMLGFATGFWGVIGILVVHKRWRYGYFQLAEDLVDWVVIFTARTTRAKGRK